ncbi:LmeA family phospholipid-binding protein [Actinomycetospora sp. C-140]
MRGCLISLLVVVAVVVGIDFGARWIAEDRVAAALQDSLSLPSEPDVDIRGFPFLTQALAGRYDDVGLSAPGIRYGQLQDLTLTADLSGVSLPLENLVNGQVRRIPAEQVTASARVNPTDLARLLDVGELTVAPLTAADLEQRRSEAEADDSGASGSSSALANVDPASSVLLTSTTSVSGQQVRVSVVASFSLSGGRITLRARDIRAEGGQGQAGQAASQALRQRLSGFSTSVDPGRLPFSITATELRAEDGELVVSGTAQDVDLLTRAGS